METLGFTATFGRVPGYAHDNKNPISMAAFAEKWQRHMQKEFNNTNILVGCVIHESRTIYPLSFGCPKDGEATITVSGHYNPKFFDEDDPDLYLLEIKRATKDICQKMQKDLGQTTVSLTFHKIEDFIYLVDENLQGSK